MRARLTDSSLSGVRGPLAALASMAALALIFVSPAQAQYYDGPAYSFPVTDMIGPAISGVSMQSYLSRSGRSNSGTARPSGSLPLPSPLSSASATNPGVVADLQIGADPAISSSVKSAFHDQLVQAHPSRRAAIDQALRQDWLAGYRDEIAAPNGLDVRNLADAVTAYTIAAWAIVNQRETIRPQAIAAVRDSMRAAMAASPQTAAMNAAERQRMAEELIHHTVLIMANRTEIARTRNKSLADSAARHYRSAALAGMQTDLAGLDLTDRGFVQR